MREISENEFKQICISMLAYIDKICRENNIKYSIAFGTLIGAIRHEGFIPWDDDIDIMLCRSDYTKLIEILQQKDDYNVISFETNPNYYYEFARLCDKRTCLTRRAYRKIDNFGVWIDIFPLDNAPAESERNEWTSVFIEKRKKMKLTIPTHYEKITLLKKLRKPYSLLKEFILRHKLKVKNFHNYRDEFREHIQKCNLYPSEDIFVADQPYRMKACFPKKWMDSTINLSFENIEVMAISNYDAFLKKIYGDYMKLPPIEKRISTHHFKAWWLS